MKFVVDRIENNIAVCILDDETKLVVPVKALPEGIKEGSVLKIVEDKEEEKKRTEKISALLDKLGSKN